MTKAKHTEDCLDANDDTSVLKGRCICAKAKHTPGPWTLKIIPNDQLAVLEENNKGGRILAVCDNNDDQDLANARLIAAAPKLLKALKIVVERELDLDEESRNYHDEDIELWKEIIAKAEGK